ncbi:MAG: HD domain-containing protein [Blautia sp.]|nr:HD domain-containing protein [Blautia sp.]
MDRIDRILNHDLFNECLDKNRAAEAERCFCHHNMAHFLDVARIGMILNLKEQQGIDEEMIYAAGLLHDIGKHLQYSHGIPHEQASAKLAPSILRDCGFNEKETDVIIKAILAHRDSRSASVKGLTGILYRADKASRPCFACQAEKECNWKGDRKNLTIKA